MASSIVAGSASATIDLQTVCQVAEGQHVALDTATADRLKKESPPPKDFAPEQTDALPERLPGPTLNGRETRATMFCRLISLVNGSTKVRLAVVQYLIDLLNARAQLHLNADSDITALQQLADAASGQGQALQPGPEASPAESGSSTHVSNAPGLSQQERNVLQSGQWASLGVAAVTVQQSRQLLLGATAVSALTAEALQLQVRLNNSCQCMHELFDSDLSHL